MDLIEKRIENLTEAIREWLSPDNSDLKDAIDKTVEEGFFGFEDVKYQVLALKKSLLKTEFKRWILKAGLNSVDLEKEKSATILCLHAGNLPLVGIQDILAVVLSGKYYIGKLSRKDPYLPESLLKILKRRNLLNGTWSSELRDLNHKQADALLFSGAATSVENVLTELKRFGMAVDDIPKLVRTAHFSIALIHDNQPETFHQLANAVLRYGGNGCRSVAMVVAPFSLKSKKCEVTDYVEEFWLKNPTNQNPAPSLFHRFAYNRAVGIEQSWLDHFMIEETDRRPDEAHILHWVVGDKDTFRSLAQKYQHSLQSLYVQDPEIIIDSLPVKTELLIDAQQPPIWWKPDGVDPLKWLSDL